MGWGSSTRRGGDRKVRALPRKFVFLGFGREESGMSREFCRSVPDPWSVHLRIGNGVGKQGYGNRPPIDDRKPIRKFSIDPLGLQNQWDNSASTDSPRQRFKEKSRYGNSVSIPHRRYGHRLRTPFLRTPFPRLLVQKVCAKKVRAHFSFPIKN